MGVRQTIADYVHAIGDYLLGRDMDAGHPGSERVLASRRRRGRRRWMGRSGRGKAEDAHRLHLAEAVEEARRQWVAARKFFDNVIEPELIDYAVFSIGAAEKRYMFLLDEARRYGVKVHPLKLND